MAVRVEFAGYKELEAQLRGAAELARPQAMERLAKNLAVILLREEAVYFREEAGPDGVRWPDLSAWTLAGRRKGGRGAKKLQDKGLLRISVTPSRGEGATGQGIRGEPVGAEPSGPNSIRRYGPWGFDIGTNRPGASAHQFGRPPIKVWVPPFFRRQRSRDVRASKRRGGQAFGIAHVRGHYHTFPAIPRRKFLGFNARAADRMKRYFASNLWLRS